MWQRILEQKKPFRSGRLLGEKIGEMKDFSDEQSSKIISDFIDLMFKVALCHQESNLERSKYSDAFTEFERIEERLDYPETGGPWKLR